jgi:hypothetical protein
MAIAICNRVRTALRKSNLAKAISSETNIREANFAVRNAPHALLVQMFLSSGAGPFSTIAIVSTASPYLRRMRFAI